MNSFKRFVYYVKAKKAFNLDAFSKLLKCMDEVGLREEGVFDYTVYANEARTRKIYVYTSDNQRYVNIYFQNIHISIDNSQNNHMIEVYLKTESEDWNIDVNDKSKCENKQLLIYRYYFIDMFNDRNYYSHETYYDGAWDKYAYQSFMEMQNIVREKTDKNIFNESYDKLYDIKETVNNKDNK